jgi:hypothetical protein
MYDLTADRSLLLADPLQATPAGEVADLVPAFVPLQLDERLVASREVVERAGQGTFRARLLSAYQGRCAVTGERSVPVLDAASIQCRARRFTAHRLTGVPETNRRHAGGADAGRAVDHAAYQCPLLRQRPVAARVSQSDPAWLPSSPKRLPV